MAFDHHNSALRHMPAALAVLVRIVSDGRPLSNLHVLVENRTPHFGTPAYIAVIEDDRIFNGRSGMNPNTSPEHGPFHHPARYDRASGHDGVNRHAAPSIFIEDELRGRIEITGGTQRPLAIIEI